MAWRLSPLPFLSRPLPRPPPATGRPNHAVSLVAVPSRSPMEGNDAALSQ
jgi:hypothetical protein